MRHCQHVVEFITLGMLNLTVLISGLAFIKLVYKSRSPDHAKNSASIYSANFMICESFVYLINSNTKVGRKTLRN